MAMLIRELVNVDNHGAFVPAVQLQDFDSAETNLSLTRSFIFTAHAPHTTGLAAHFYSTLEILDKFKNSFLADSDNVIMLLADYGHGKSHLGLQAMNYFGQNTDSEVFSTLMERVETAAGGDKAIVRNLRTFREERQKPFLVLHMSGDANKSIREMFYNALLKELKRHGVQNTIHLPFWNENAKKWVDSHKNDTAICDLLGNKYGTDIPTLLQDIDQNRDGAWDKYVAIFRLVNHGNSPSSTDHKNPQEMVDWVMAELVGDNKPFSGLTVFFDEFSIFLRTAANRADDLDIPQLLHGVGDNNYRGKALLLLLGHRDPTEDLQASIANPALLSQLMHHIGHIHNKWKLFTVVESVLDSFLSNSRPSWEKLKMESPIAVGGMTGTNANESFEYFKSRYQDELDWDFEKFLNVVVKGCFPLHPTTTALLSSVRLRMENIGATRSLLKFVRGVYDAKKDLPILVNGKVNWVLPIDLVEFFGDSLVDDMVFGQYDLTLRNIQTNFAGMDATTEILVSQALLLQLAARFDKYSGSQQIDLLSHFSGLTSAVTRKALENLEQHSILQFDPVSRHYSFRIISGGMDVMDDIKTRAMTKSLDAGNSQKFADAIRAGSLNVPQFTNMDIAVDWGHASDWYVSQFILTRANFTKERLKELVPEVKFGGTEPKAQAKGALVWCLAANDADRDYFRNQAPLVLAEAFNDGTPPPMLVMTPDLPRKSLVDGFLLYLAAKELLVDNAMVSKYGDQTISREVGSLEKKVKLELSRFLQQPTMRDQVNETFFVPAAYTTDFINLDSRSRSFNAMFLKMYRKAYQIGAPDFFTDVKAYTNASTVSASAKKVGAFLAMNTLPTLMTQAVPGAIDKRLVDNYLKTSWGVVTQTYALIEPRDTRLARVWNEMDDHFQVGVGEVRVGSILQKLMNPPFGFDPNTVWLVFCAWIGTRSGSIHLFKNSRSISVKAFMDEFNAATRTVSVNLNKVIIEGKLTLSRSEQGQMDADIKHIIETLHSHPALTVAAATPMMDTLEDYLINGGGNDGFTVQAQNALDALKGAFKERKEFEEKWKKLNDKIQRENQLDRLVQLTAELTGFREPTLITSELKVLDLQDAILERTLAKISSLVDKATTFTKLENAGLIRMELDSALEAVKSNSDWAAQVRDTMERFEKRVIDLTAGKDEESLRAQIRVLTTPNLPLVTTRNNLDELRGLIVPDSLTNQKSQGISQLQNDIQQTEAKARFSLDNYLKVDEQHFNKFRNDVIKNILLTKGSEFESQLDDIVTYLDELQRFYVKVQKISSMGTTNYRATINGLEEISAIHSEFSAILSPDHMIPINRLSQVFEARKKTSETTMEAELVVVEGIIVQEKANLSGSLDIQKYQLVINRILQQEFLDLRERAEKAKADLVGISNRMDAEKTMIRIESLFKMLNSNEKEQLLEKLRKI